MIWCGLKIEEICYVLVSQFHGNFRSKIPNCRKIEIVFGDVKWCFNASWGLKGLTNNNLVHNDYTNIEGKGRYVDQSPRWWDISKLLGQSRENWMNSSPMFHVWCDVVVVMHTGQIHIFGVSRGNNISWHPANTRTWAMLYSMLAQCHRRWTNIEPRYQFTHFRIIHVFLSFLFER